MNFSNVRIAKRLGMGFGLVLLMLTVMMGVGVLELRNVQANMDSTLALERRALIASEWSNATRLNITRVLAIAKSKNAPEVESYFNPLIAQTTQKINELQKSLEESVESAEGKALLAKVAQLRADYIAARKAYFEALKAGDAGAEGLLSGKLMPAADAYMSAQSELIKLQHGFVDQYIEVSRSGVALSVQIIIGLAVVALALGVTAAVWIARSVTQPLQDALKAAQNMAQGDLTQTIRTTRKDELGNLLQALSDMQGSLQKAVGQIRQSSDSIAMSSTEVASGNQDLSMRTEQAASNLQETASSMEELTATVKQSADAARQANQLASSAAEVAQKGGAVVSQVVTTMQDINHSSQKIADIIGVIDGIAFQTNILALNAAVEAARAGEQGRGFAVVAGEVRTLAQRSAQAAKEIKDLINASVQKVQSGSSLVQEAGSTMDEIVHSVQRVTDIIGEITAASSEQSDGIGQVNVAINQLDQMTQQNAALVEQSAAAAESLRDQAERLSQVISVFKTGDASGYTPVTRAAPKTKMAPRTGPGQLPPPRAAAAPKALGSARVGAGLPRPAALAKAVPAPKVAAKPAVAPKAAAEPLKRPVLNQTAKASEASSEGDWESF
ncbi:MAG: Methyl-accepting chemotaxis protein [Pseudomonadota bacterium]